MNIRICFGFRISDFGFYGRTNGSLLSTLAPPWLPQRHAAGIRAMLARRHVNAEWGMRSGESRRTWPLELSDLKRFVAGADVFSKQGDGTTVAAQYARLGDVAAGIRPALFLHRRCARLAETLPALQHDPNRPEDMLTGLRA